MTGSTGADVVDQAASGPASGRPPRRWVWLGGLLSVGMVATIILQLGGATTEVLAAISRLPPLVWPALLLLYLIQPLSDFAIFRRLWSMPLAGFETLLRKNVINEVVLGYSGEAYLYVWARRAASVIAEPLAAIKDANIVSALLGNLLTLVLAAVSATQLRDMDFARRMGPALWSGIIPLAISLGVLLWGRRVFSLRLSQLAYVSLVCCLRLGIWTALTILVWRLAMPEVRSGVWVVLLAIRYLISRIPLISNKELVFGNLMLLLLGAHSNVAVLLAALALVTLVLHLSVIVGLGVLDLARSLRRASGASVVNAGGVHDY
ncbi:hypothetical protein [Caulobacter segnis]|uniref:hypothetical protein n=1 Tax=Caulobacter segnis TaxID=88688 RepID=UPI002855E16D|nr:hypothetical protein [Caulobacter segnis]MDR6625227.1 hypothetical protein [Caulobacter segnis]